VRDALRERLSAKTVAATLTTCAAVFKLAQRRGYVTSNPAALAERPRRAVVELGGDDEGSGVRPEEVLSADEIKRLLEAAEPGRWRSLFTTVAATGLRVEEVLALRWGDLELLDGHGRLFVRRSLSWARGVGEEGRVRPKFFEPKTKAGRREIPLQDELVRVLKVWKLQCPASEHDPLVFCNAVGEPLRRGIVLNQGLHPALRRAKLRQVNVKTLRHSFASGLILAGAPITEVQHRLGHASPAVTLRVYSHWFRDAETGAADRFAAGFLGSVPTLGTTGVTRGNVKAAKLQRK